MNKKNIGIVITDGVGYRNFVATDFLSKFETQNINIVLISFLPKNAYDASLLKRLTFVEVEDQRESKLTWFFRKLKELAHLQRHKDKNFGFKDNLNANRAKKFTLNSILVRSAFLITHFLNNETWINKFEKWQLSSYKNQNETRELEETILGLDLHHLFFTHQRPTYLGPLIYIAKKLQIKKSAFIFSWDNLASKGRMAGSFDFYLVWSELMKSELLKFYGKLNEQQVFVVGTPQFEPYFTDKFITTKKEFCERFQLDEKLKTICFSCGDISTSKNDELYIQIIAKAIDEGSVPKVNLIVRTSPAEDPIRFEKIIEDYPHIHWNFPAWNNLRKEHSESWSQRVPSMEDIKDLTSLVSHVDININMLSTMSLDFICKDKAVINPVFGNANNSLYDDQRFFNYQHIQIMMEKNATSVVKNEAELIEAINLYLANPERNKNERKALLDLEISKPIPGTAQRISDLISSF